MRKTMSAASTSRERCFSRQARTSEQGAPVAATPLFLVASFLMGAGLALTFSSLTLGLTLSVLVGAICGIACAGLALLHRRAEAWKRAFYASIILMALSLMISASGVAGFLAHFVNLSIVAWDGYTASYVLPFALDLRTDLMATVAIVIFLTGLVTLVFWMLIRAGKSALTLFVTIAFALWYLFVPDALPVVVALLVIGGVMVVALQTIARFERGPVRGKDDGRGVASALSASFTIVVVLLVSLLMIVPGAQGEWPGATALRDDIIAQVDQFRFGSDTLGEGNFSKSIYMNNTAGDDAPTRLEVSYSDPTAFSAQYFRGFVGSEYTGFSFEQPLLENYLDEWNGFFEWADTLDFDPVLQNGTYVMLDEELQGSRMATKQITISTREANRKYSYAPYLTLAQEEARQLLDLRLEPSGFSGQQSSQVEEVDALLFDESFAPNGWVNVGSEANGASSTEAVAAHAQGFAQAEHAYRSFVYEHYLEVPDSVAPVISGFFTAEDRVAGDGDLYTVATHIRSTLEARCLYTAAPSPYDPAVEGDFVNWFLNDQKKGNSAAFAAAATLAFREVGIPARYAEGYILTTSDAQALAQAGQDTASLTEKAAHAWVEVYVDGAGFVPIEVTPGFFDNEYQAETTIEIAREVVGDGSDSESSGSLDTPWQDMLPDELEPFAWLGLILLAVIVVLVVYAILEVQRYFRRRHRTRALEQAIERSIEASRNTAETIGLTSSIAPLVSARCSARLERALRFAPFAFDAAFPRRSASTIADFVPGLDVGEYERVVDLVERERFGSVAINAHEAAFIDGVITKIEGAVWRQANPWQRFVMRYGYLIDLPLG